MEKSIFYSPLISPMSSHLRHIGKPARPSYPYPVYSTHSTSSAYDLSTTSFDIDIQGVFSNTWVTPMAESSYCPLIRHIASPNDLLEQPVRGKKWQRTTQRTTIDMLPEDTLLEIFDFYRLDAVKQSRLLLPRWKWHRLAHVCRKWRHVISISPRRLDLRILCESKAPIEGILGSWPTLPLFVRHKGPKSKSLPNNVVLALRRPFRICEIDLILPSSLIGPIVEVIQEPLQALECIRITVKNTTGLPVLVRDAFLGGSSPRLREIKLDGIAFPFPAIRQVLLSTNNLVELHLPDIPNEVYFSPDDLVTGLSTSVQLKRLTVGFYSPASSPPPTMTRPPPQRATLPSLRIVDFHGAVEYLEEFVARIDLPALRKITIRLFNQIFFEIPQFSQFISCPKALRSPNWIVARHSAASVRVSFRKTADSDDLLFLETSCIRLDWQLSFVTQISSQLSPILSSVHSIKIIDDPEFPTGKEDVDPTQWLELFQPFDHVTKVHVWEKELVPGIVQALVIEDMATEILPELNLLSLSRYHDSPSVAKAAEHFVATRKLSGRTINLIN